MKKFRLIILVLLGVSMGLMVGKGESWQARATELNYREIVEDTTLTGEIDITSEYAGQDVLIVSSGATLILNDVTFVSNNSTIVDNIIKVNAGGKVILNNVDFRNVNSNCGINNYGQVIVNDGKFGSNNTLAIENNSLESSSLIIRGGIISSVALNSGYITLDEYTNLNTSKYNSGNYKYPISIGVSLPNDDSLIGKVLVKGNNIFAGYYQGLFCLANNETTYNIDYAGEGCTLENVGFGDLILTKLKINAYINGNKKTIANKYATANSYLETMWSEGVFAVVLDNDGRVIDNVSCLSKSFSSASVSDEYSVITIRESGTNETIYVADNSKHLIFVPFSVGKEVTSATSTSSRITTSITNYIGFAQVLISTTSSANATINITIQDKVMEPTYSITKDNSISLDISGHKVGDTLTTTFTLPENLLLDSLVINGNVTEYDIGENNLISFEWQVEQDNIIIINTSNKPVISYVDVIYPESIIYNGLDNLPSIRPYYLESADKHYLDFVISMDNVIVTECICVGIYEIEITSEINNVVFNNPSSNFVISQLEIEVAPGTFNYIYGDSENPTENYLVTETNETISITYTRESGFDVGDYDLLTLSTTNNNYALSFAPNANTDRVQISCRPITINFGTYEFEYDGVEKEVVATAENVIGWDIVNITLNNNRRTNAGNQIVTIASIDNPNYILADSDVSVVLKINKATFDESIIVYANQEVDYTGQEVTLVSTSVIPSYIVVTYENNTHINAGIYDCIMNLELISSNYYPLSKTELVAQLTIRAIDIPSVDLGVNVSSRAYNKMPILYSLKGTLPSMLLLRETKFYKITNETRIECEVPTNVGRYVCKMIFEVNSVNYNNIEPIEKEFEITKATINESNFQFNDRTAPYSGNNQYVRMTNVPNDVTINYTGNYKKNVGRYTVIATLSVDTDNYNDLVTKIYTAYLTITKATYDMSSITFNNETKIYNKSEHTLLISGQLPQGVSVLRYTNNTATNRGEYNASVEFVGDADNYEQIPTMYATLTISPKVLTISLVRSVFDYTGNDIEVVPNVTGVIEGDEVVVTLASHRNINANVYYATISSISNNNYTCVDNTRLMYEIKPIAIDLSYITFGNFTKTYDGEVYIPALVGDIPAGVQANISYPTIKNVGKYTAIVEFIVNSNYIKPTNLQAEITINRRPVYIEFSGYEDIVANGDIKSISVKLSNVVKDEYVGYEVIYSSIPIEAGNYTCSVELNSNSNYYIVGSSSIDFVIKVDKKVFNNNDIMVEVTGEHFLAESEVKLESIEEQQVVNTLKSINGNVKNYAMYKLVVDDENIGKVTVAIKSNTLSVKQSNYLRVYKLLDGGLEEIAFEVSEGKIIFEASPNDELILIQEENLTTQNITMVVIVSIVATAIFVCLISIVITYIKQKKFFIVK